MPRNKRFYQIALILLVLLAISSNAFAGEPLPWDNGLKKFGDALTSSTAFYIAIIAFAASAIQMIWGGEMSQTVKNIVVTMMVVSFVVAVPAFLKNFLGIQVTGAELPIAHAYGHALTTYVGHWLAPAC